MSLLSLMVHKLDIQLSAVTTGAAGGKVRAWTTTTAKHIFRIEELSAIQRDRLYEQLHIESSHKAFTCVRPPAITKQNMSEYRLLGAASAATPTDLVGRVFEIRGFKNEQELGRLWEFFLFESEFIANQP